MGVQKVPDAQGTIAVTGLEQIVDSFNVKDTFRRQLDDELSDIKGWLRNAVKEAMRGAQGAVRVFVRGSAGGVTVTAPDLSKDGNRPIFDNKKEAQILKAGGVEQTGLSPADIYEDITDEGGEQVVLRGIWAQWFVDKLIRTGQASFDDPNITWERKEPTITRRLKVDAIPKLEIAAAAGSAVAKLILELGTKAWRVMSEDR